MTSNRSWDYYLRRSSTYLYIFLATNSPESYFLSTHTNVSDSTVFATINFQVTQLLVEVVIEVINSPDNKQKKYGIHT